MGFTVTIWILLLLGTLSAYKAGSYVSTYHAILVVFIVAAEPSIAYCIWGDQYLTAIRNSNVVSLVSCVAYVFMLQRYILLAFNALYYWMTSDAALIKDGSLGGQEMGSVYGTGREQVNREK
ncbi:hypothetical protein L210DRAFT_2226430 [Boletus edulis BED1]|uniref:Uncharacterized protein n=1 Tax=Boletus edulis BED1 TaxID=1328754 RepID=A0AAD4BCT4_BOLED|nr:hypothetical protein L210DRAFT_2226430 [Boletus edulis BED1]